MLVTGYNCASLARGARAHAPATQHTGHSLTSPHVQSTRLIRIERGKERMLERRVLGRLLEVAVHLAGRREDALDLTANQRVTFEIDCDNGWENTDSTMKGCYTIVNVD